jgi:hypothetical protein
VTVFHACTVADLIGQNDSDAGCRWSVESPRIMMLIASTARRIDRPIEVARIIADLLGQGGGLRLPEVERRQAARETMPVVVAGDSGLDRRLGDGHAVSYMVALRTSPAGFPMAPSVEEWAALSPADRAAVVAALPGEVTYDEMAMPEGDRHSKAKARALDALRGYFTRQRRRIYLA